MLVDDEVLAMEYLQNLIEWEKYGYCIVGCAINAKRALELYEKEKPDIVISDIRMVGMDGLELARQLKLKNPGVVILLLSAYRDFDYALKGIQYGVSNYLLKHELSEETLLSELNRIQNEIALEEKKKKIYRNYFMKQLIYNHIEEEEFRQLDIGKRFFVMMLHKNSVFLNGLFHETEWTKEEMDAVSEILEQDMEEIYYVVDAQITPNNLMVLYRIENISSKYKVNSLIEQKAEKISSCLLKVPGCYFNIVFSYEVKPSEISAVFQKMSKQIRYAMFWKSCQAYALNKLQKIGEEERISWNEQMEELRNMIYEGDEVPKDFIRYLFDIAEYPSFKLRTIRELLLALENMLREMEEKEGISLNFNTKELCKVGEIKEYYITYITRIYIQIHTIEAKTYSRMVLQVMRYIKKNYPKELSLESLGEEFQMNGVYLGQIFREEVGITFLKYLTNLRIEEAKRLLEEGNRNVSEVAEEVGYKTSQYFSQIFIKNVGVKPQEYRKWGRKK